MASPPGPGSANRALSSSSRGPLSPFPGAARDAVPFLRHHHPPGGDSDGGASMDEFDEDDDDDDDDEEEDQDAELAARSSLQRRDSSPAGVGQRPVVNGENGARQIQEGQQWQLYSCGTEQPGRASSRGDEEPGSVPREMRVEDGYGVIGRREGGPASSYWDLLRAHLSDPLTGILMDDAMILSCGHSYGSSGMQHIYRMKACGKCGQPITEDSIRPNLALGLAVQAFRREEESAKTLKRRRDRIEQDKCGNDDPNPAELSRGKGVQYPFAVFDRVIIKGNKRTPERFVGRVAVVTAQCLNGWYVVKTLDNAESVKLQYRSLAKFVDGGGGEPPAVASNSSQNASWL
ncbi:U-box domain-containing protein 62-like [Triticum urartu]|uniref:PUB 62/63 C-terminal domain-containing protein n=2 Tax=Triticum urartu TaxID=4572 RepID=A0A8R7QKQ7_TRIUA|nr:U-box domain-containing protein 62-like [Triticum urartu]XP_048532373.1 U-box domain-containing protein 62-like [Triticum urartu]